MADTATRLAELREDRAAIRAARTRILSVGQSVGSNGRQLTRADYDQLGRDLRRIDREIARIEGSGGMRRVVPQ